MVDRGDRRKGSRVGKPGKVKRGNAQEFWDGIGMDLDGLSPEGWRRRDAVLGRVWCAR